MSFAIAIDQQFARLTLNIGTLPTVAAELTQTVLACEPQARLLAGLTLGELVPFSSLHCRAGLYVVFQGQTPVYVGTCRSQPYLVRIPAHLAAEAGDYMNSLAKVGKLKGQHATLLDAAQAVARECRILFLTVGQERGASPETRGQFVHVLMKLERALQTQLQTNWNNLKKQAKTRVAPGNG